MKKLLLLFFGVTLYGQNNTLTENFNVKLGILEASIAYECPIKDSSFLLNFETSYLAGFTNSDFLFTTEFTIEPRFYYNINKRVNKGKSVKNNSGNYLSLELNYIPDFLTQSSSDNLDVIKSFDIIPTYGLRRNIGGNFNFDFEFGLGYSFLENEQGGELTGNLFIGISYLFK